MQKRWVLALVVALVVVGLMQTVYSRPSAAQGQSGSDTSDVPYIYYYSNDLNAWVIERADGTDRRLLGQGVAPAEANTVSGGVWSSSGKWFTWSSATLLSGDPWFPTYENWQYWLTDTLDNSQVSNTDFGSWSPAKDRMLVEDARNYVRLPFFGRTLPSWLYYLRYSLTDIEGNTNEVVFERRFVDLYTGSQVEWLEDGQSILFRYWRYRGDKADVTFVLRSPNGELTFYRTVADSYAVLPKGVIAHLHHRTLILTDLVHQKNRVIRLDIPNSLSLGMNWNETGDAVFVMGQREDNSPISVWWLDLHTSQLHLVTQEMARFSWLNGNDVQQISPTGRYLAYIDTNNSVNYFDSLTEKTTHLGIRIGRENIYDWADQFYWTDDSHLIVFPSTELEYYAPSPNFILVDAAVHMIRILPFGLDVRMPPQRASNGRHLAWVRDAVEILDLRTGELVIAPPDSRAWISNWGGFIHWHPDGQWLIAGDEGGSTDFGLYYLSIVSADGQIRREIYTDGIVNWLPSEVNPDSLPALPTVPIPAQTIRGLSLPRSRDVVWSQDGQFLWTGIGIWDVEHKQFVESVDSSLFLSATTTPSKWEGVEPVVFSPNRQMVAARLPLPAEYPYPAVYHTESHEILFQIPRWGYMQTTIFSPDSRYLVISYAKWQIEVWDTETWTKVVTLPVSSPAVAFSPDGQYLAVGVSWDVEIWRVSDLIGEQE